MLFTTLGWVICAALIAVVVYRHVQIATNATTADGSALALTYDALPLLLLLPWCIVPIALWSEHYVLMAVALALCGYHLWLVIPRLVADPVPRWVHGAPRLTLVVDNVFVDNQTPADAARQIVRCGADVVVIVESTADFMATFDQQGGDRAYPNRVIDPDVNSDYAIAVVSTAPLGPRTEFRTEGPLRVAIADVDVHGTSVLVVALNPMATVDEGGHETWQEQLQALAKVLSTLNGPMVVAGDLNSTRYRPEFEQITELGFTDAIDALGKGLSPSFKLTAGNAVGGVVRLDHALTSADVHGVRMHNLEACGSDHLPFLLEMAVRPSKGVTPLRT